MELIVIEVLLWAALIFFFWALKDNLGRVETDIENFGLLRMRASAHSGPIRGFDRADKFLEPIGHYCNAPIYQYVVIGERYFRFDRVCPNGVADAHDDERCLAPGLIYVAVTGSPAPLTQ